MPKLNKLTDVMLVKKVSPETLVKKTELSARTIWSAQKGSSVSMTTAKLIARALGVKPEELR